MTAFSDLSGPVQGVGHGGGCGSSLQSPSNIPSNAKIIFVCGTTLARCSFFGQSSQGGGGAGVVVGGFVV